MEIDAGLLPMALDGSFRDVFHGGDFEETESAKEAEVDDFGERSIVLGECVEGIADARQLTVVCEVLNVGTERGDLEKAAAFLNTAAAGVIDDEAAHDAGGISHESGFIGKAHALSFCHFDVGLMKEGGCADGHGQA